MVKQIVRDVFFLGQPSEPATKADIQDGQHRSASMKLIICLERLFNRMWIANIRFFYSTEFPVNASADRPADSR